VGELGFNIASCQFALHYFFQNSQTFHQFLRNVAECTKIGGHFIGTCYDGETVFKMLKSIKRDEGITIMKNDRKIWVEKGLDPREFDNFEYQKSYAVNEKNDPYWFDMSLESKGVMQTKDVLNLAVAILRKNVSDFMKEALDNIRRSEEKDTYVISVVNGGHTIGGLFQEVLYGDMNVRYVGYDIRHPLKTDMDIPLVTDKTPESVLKNARDSIEEYCKVLEKAL
jgi:DNA-directed RNA polymerase subunit L